MTQIVFNSQNETDILGFKVSRCNEEDVNEQQLLNEIIEGRYDICRLKLPAEDEMISMKLESLGIPFFFSGSIRRYRTKIIEKTLWRFLPSTNDLRNVRWIPRRTLDGNVERHLGRLSFGILSRTLFM